MGGHLYVTSYTIFLQKGIFAVISGESMCGVFSNICVAISVILLLWFCRQTGNFYRLLTSNTNILKINLKFFYGIFYKICPQLLFNFEMTLNYLNNNKKLKLLN